jgi:hypothetical protein
MPEIDLEPSGYRQSDSKPVVVRRGLAKWLYFVRHPILAFVTYQKAYPDPPDEEQTSVRLNALSMGLFHYLWIKFKG